MSIDSTTVTIVLAVALGSVGYSRGVRAEGITLAGITGFTIVFTAEAISRQAQEMVSRSPVAPILGGADQQVFLSDVLFLVAVGLMYAAGASLGGKPLSSLQRITGAILGALNGFVVSFGLASLSQGFFSRHKEFGQVSLPLPKLPSPGIAGISFPSYSLYVLAGALSLVAFIALASLVKARR